MKSEDETLEEEVVCNLGFQAVYHICIIEKWTISSGDSTQVHRARLLAFAFEILFQPSLEPSSEALALPLSTDVDAYASEVFIVRKLLATSASCNPEHSRDVWWGCI